MKTASSYLGGILLVAGTSIGVGILALPVSTSFGGFIPSLCIFLVIWAVMLATAYFLLEVNLALPGEPNLISMVEKTLGKWGKTVSWVFYLLLLYSLLAAYLSACAPLFASFFQTAFHLTLPAFIFPFLLPIVFSGFICFGTRGIDYFNRILILGLVISYGLLVGTVPEHMEVNRLFHRDFTSSLFAVPVIITSFGYHIIIPTLTTYMKHDVKSLRKILLWGSLIPLVVCILWQVVVLGALPQKDLSLAWKLGVPATDPLAKMLQSDWIAYSARFFSFFAIITSFLGVALSLSDFLRDGLSLKKNWEGKLFAILLTFIPPLLFLFFCQKTFYIALEYAGSFVAILLGIIPALMVLKLKKHSWYQSLKGRTFVFFILFLCVGVVLINGLEKFGFFQEKIMQYLR